MADVNWEEIRAEYLAGGISCRELAEKHHISQNVVQKKATKEGWKKLRQKTGEKAAEKASTRVARARASAAVKGLDMVKYTMGLWTENLNQLNELIKATPAYMLSVPAFASGIAKGLDTTYELLKKMAGKSDGDKKLMIEREKLRIAREQLKMDKERFELEKKKFEADMAKAASDTGMSSTWVIREDTEAEAEDG